MFETADKHHSRYPDVTPGSSLGSSVDRLWQGLRSGLTDDWRAGPPIGSQVLYRWETSHAGSRSTCSQTSKVRGEGEMEKGGG